MLNNRNDAVFISELLGGETSPQNSQIPPKMLRDVINYTLNTLQIC